MMEAMRNNPGLPREEMRKLLGSEQGAVEPATLADGMAHIDHIRKIAGVDYIGIGTDYDGVGCVPKELGDVSKFPVLTRALLEHGYSAEDVRKIYGGNLLRVMRAVEKAAEPETRAGAARTSSAAPVAVDTHNE
jgi:membrane dipeptidase